MITINPCGPPFRKFRSAQESNASEHVSRKNRDDALLRAHVQTAPFSLRKRGAAGFRLSNPGSTINADAYRVYKATQLEEARSRVLNDADLQELLHWSASIGRPLNLRGCNLSGANLRHASLRGACLAFTNATGADVRGADLTGANLEDSRGWERS